MELIATPQKQPEPCLSPLQNSSASPPLTWYQDLRLDISCLLGAEVGKG